jgi:hypothetical protein
MTAINIATMRSPGHEATHVSRQVALPLLLQRREVDDMSGSVRERTSTKRERIELQLDDRASIRQHRELGAFVRYCVIRIERELGEPERWMVRIVPTGSGFRSTVSLEDGELALQSSGAGLDGALAVWDALCSLEQALREARARQSMSVFGERFDHG